MPDDVFDPEPTPPEYAIPQYAVEKIQTASMALGSLRNPPVRKVVEQQIVELEAQLKERREFLKDLDAEPGVEKILDRMRKLHI